VNRAALLSLSHDDLIALILAQQAQIEAQAHQISILTARVAELEAKLAAPGKTPDNSSLPPSKGQKPNLPDRTKKARGGRPGVARALAEHPDRIIEASSLPVRTAPTRSVLPTWRRPMPTTTSSCRRCAPLSPALTAIAASVPAARSVSPPRRRTVSIPAHHSELACRRSSSTCTSPRRSAFSVSSG
jgi:hypothetical protein